MVAVGAWALLGPEGAREARADEGMLGTELVAKQELDRFTYLKRLSLDLRGTVPEFEEFEALEGEADVPEATIDAMLASDAFLDTMRDYHRSLLWTNVNNIDFVNFNWDLTRTTVGPTEDRHTVYYVRRKSDEYRGGPEDREGMSIPCGHWEQTEWNSDGSPVTMPGDDGRRMDGWVWVEPYWNQGNPSASGPIKVCAFDAQTAAYSTTGVECKSRASSRELSCGCGPNLNWCGITAGFNNELVVGEQINAQMLQLVEWVIANDRPYHELLTTNRSFVNGPLIHYYKYQNQLASNVDLSPSPVDTVFLPDMDFNDYRWVEVVQGDEHAGILTSIGFLLRFQTNRSRVNTFYNVFLDNYFDSTKGTDPDDCSKDSANLRERCGCGSCHRNVEPWAAYWGRFKEQGSGFLEPQTYPAYSEECERCAQDPTLACSTTCRNNYVVETVPEDHLPYLGQLKSLEFLEESEFDHTVGGPKLWVQRTLYDGSLARGVVSKLWQRLMQRPFSNSAADLAIRDDLIRTFVESDYNLKALVKAIVTHPAYRRIR